MALKGTLEDFGIAEILQLIGQQAKSGVLHLEAREEVVHIAIAEGSVVRAESAGRQARDRLGNLLVRAEIISKNELEYALDQQKKSLRRLGDILVELGFVSEKDLREVTQLQTAETIYRLFHWKSGTYEFEPGDVEWDPSAVTPLRAESVLMEGFRRLDEWPLVRKKIGSPAMTFERLREVLPEDPAADAGIGSDVDDAFDALGGEKRSGKGEFESLGRNERRCFEIAVEGRTVERIVDLSRLGEFETCKALLNLVNLGFLGPIAPSGRASGSVGGFAPDWQASLRRGAARALATVLVAALIAGIAAWVDRRGLTWGASGREVGDNGVQRYLARYQLEILRSALEIYRLERGEYPESLGALVEAGLASARDLRHPWRQEYFYRRKPGGSFVLLPPVE